MRVLIIFMVVLFSKLGFSESKLPQGCYPMKVHGEMVTIEGKKNNLIMVHNLTETDLWVTHPVSNASASAGWSSRVQPNNWSALLVEKPPFVLSCIESRPGHEQQIPCEGSIAVCHWRAAAIPASEKGTFWVGEDLSLNALMTAIGTRGIVLPAKEVKE